MIDSSPRLCGNGKPSSLVAGQTCGQMFSMSAALTKEVHNKIGSPVQPTSSTVSAAEVPAMKAIR